MDWNSRPPSHWDWESLGLSHAKTGDHPREALDLEWGMGDGSLCSSAAAAAAGFCSACDMGNGGCSSKSSTIDFSVTEEPNPPGINLEPPTPKHPDEMKDLARTEHTGISAEMVESVGSAEPFIGLKLGKRTYFEDVCPENLVKNASFSSDPAASSPKVKRSRASLQGEQVSRCQVEGCDLDLASAKDYHRKHRVCESHSKCPRVIVAGRECRFCQQCSRFHHLSEFDQKKRSCRRRLSDHNARRRKPPASARLSSSYYDRRLQMDHLLSQSPFGGVGTTSPLWESSFDIDLMQAKGSSVRLTKAGGLSGQPRFPTNGSSTAVATPQHNFQQLLPFSSTTTQVLNQGLEATSDASNLGGAPDFRRALSLLSNNPCGSGVGSGEASPIDLFSHLHNAGAVGTPRHLPFMSSGFWQVEPAPPHQEAPRVRPFAAHGDGNQFQEFHLLKASYGNAFFDSTRSLYSEKAP